MADNNNDGISGQFPSNIQDEVSEALQRVGDQQRLQDFAGQQLKAMQDDEGLDGRIIERSFEYFQGGHLINGALENAQSALKVLVGDGKQGDTFLIEAKLAIGSNDFSAAEAVEKVLGKRDYDVGEDKDEIVDETLTLKVAQEQLEDAMSCLKVCRNPQNKRAAETATSHIKKSLQYLQAYMKPDHGLDNNSERIPE